MKTPQYIRIADYDYALPDERIAKYPITPRDSSKLLLYQQGKISEDTFRNIGNYLPTNALLVYNNTRVIQARLVFRKQTGARIEVFCLEPIAPHDYALSLSATGQCTWKCMVGNLKKWKEKTITHTIEFNNRVCTLTAERLASNGNTHTIAFSWDAADLSFAEILEKIGELPIPPYLNRPTEECDKTTYQTVYSRIKGSVAAPTAGLHFTQEVLADLHQRGIRTDELTLHVGAGTFQPVKTDNANEHTMHTEIISVPRRVIENVLQNLGHIVAVGTTSVRTLESLYFLGAAKPTAANGFELCVSQFEPYEDKMWPTIVEALQNLLHYLDETQQDTLHAQTQIMIKPGYHFRIVNQIITNFHQPKSTLLLLVSAFVKGNWRGIYDYALAHNFRFLSYGDSSLLIP